MSFPFNVYLLGLLGAVLGTALSLPFWRALCMRLRLVDEPGPRKIHEKPVALAGGLAVLTGMCVPVLFGAGLLLGPEFEAKSLLVNAPTADVLAYGLGRRGTQLAAIVLGALAMTGLGLIDDRYELRAASKFLGQLAIAALVAAGGVRVTLFVPSPLFSYLVTIGWILTVTNALNFMDNMNGLCAGLGIIGAWCFALWAATDGHYLVTLMALVVCGALLGFLPYNFPRATVFLGDSGSHLVGYLLAVLAILPHFHSPQHPRPVAVLTPLAVLAVPLLDLAWVVGRRWRAGKAVYVGDTGHLSHRLVQKGLRPSTAVLLIWLAAAITGAATLL